MSLLEIRPRELARDTDQLRDDRLFYVATDDKYAPDQYFKFFQIPRIKIDVIPTTDGTSHVKHVLTHLLERKKNEALDDGDELWMLLDTDHCITGSHLESFQSPLNQSKLENIQIAISRPCFELWLLLHVSDQLDEITELKNAAETEIKLKNVLGRYNKTKLKKEDYPLSSVRLACERARKLDTSPDSDIPPNNASRVYKLWDAILGKSLPSQLPVDI